MCNQLYIATDQELPLGARGPVTVEAVDAELDSKLRASFKKPFLRFVTADGTCSCDFPSFPEPVEHFDWIFDEETEEERAQSVECVRRLMHLVVEALDSSTVVEAYLAYAGHEELPPKGRIAVRVQDVQPDRFYFVERHLYEFRAQ